MLGKKLTNDGNSRHGIAKADAQTPCAAGGPPPKDQGGITFGLLHAVADVAQLQTQRRRLQLPAHAVKQMHQMRLLKLADLLRHGGMRNPQTTGRRREGAGFGNRLWIVSNNSSDTADTLAARLAAMGFAMQAAQIVLAGEETIRRVAQERPGQRVAVHAAEPLCALARQLGLITDHNAPDVAILAGERGFCLASLTRLTA